MKIYVENDMSKLNDPVSFVDFLPKDYVLDGSVDYTKNIQSYIDYCAVQKENDMSKENEYKELLIKLIDTLDGCLPMHDVEDIIKEARELLKPDPVAPPHGAHVICAGKFLRTSKGYLNGSGDLACYNNAGDTDDSSWVKWKLADIPNPLRWIDHDGSDECPIADGVLHFVEYKGEVIVSGSRNPSDRSWGAVERYAVFSE